MNKEIDFNDLNYVYKSGYNTSFGTFTQPKTLFGKMEHIGITLDYVESQQKTFKLRLNQNKRNYTAYK